MASKLRVFGERPVFYHCIFITLLPRGSVLSRLHLVHDAAGIHRHLITFYDKFVWILFGTPFHDWPDVRKYIYNFFFVGHNEYIKYTTRSRGSCLVFIKMCVLCGAMKNHEIPLLFIALRQMHVPMCYFVEFILRILITTQKQTLFEFSLLKHYVIFINEHGM